MSDVRAIGEVNRDRLPGRRQHRTRTLIWVDPRGGEHEFEVAVGFYPAPGAPGLLQRRAGEIFVTVPQKEDSSMRYAIEDDAVIVSKLLQYGETLETIYRALGALWDNGNPQTAIKAIVGLARYIEAETPTDKYGKPTTLSIQGD